MEHISYHVQQVVNIQPLQIHGKLNYCNSVIFYTVEICLSSNIQSETVAGSFLPWNHIGLIPNSLDEQNCSHNGPPARAALDEKYSWRLVAACPVWRAWCLPVPTADLSSVLRRLCSAPSSEPSPWRWRHFSETDGLPRGFSAVCCWCWSWVVCFFPRNCRLCRIRPQSSLSSGEASPMSCPAWTVYPAHSALDQAILGCPQHHLVNRWTLLMHLFLDRWAWSFLKLSFRVGSYVLRILPTATPADVF